MSDPNFEGVDTHFILVPAGALPEDLPLDANPRDPNVNRPVYRAVAKSLREEDDSVDGSFHLKHRGIVPITDIARMLALAMGKEPVNTVHRLRACAGSNMLSNDMAWIIPSPSNIHALLGLR